MIDTIAVIAAHIERYTDRATHGHRAAVDRHARCLRAEDRPHVVGRHQHERGECTRRRDQERGRRAAERRRSASLEA